jgi:hypothetical protein
MGSVVRGATSMLPPPRHGRCARSPHAASCGVLGTFDELAVVLPHELTPAAGDHDAVRQALPEVAAIAPARGRITAVQRSPDCSSSTLAAQMQSLVTPPAYGSTGHHAVVVVHAEIGVVILAVRHVGQRLTNRVSK